MVLPEAEVREIYGGALEMLRSYIRDLRDQTREQRAGDAERPGDGASDAERGQDEEEVEEDAADSAAEPATSEPGTAGPAAATAVAAEQAEEAGVDTGQIELAQAAAIAFQQALAAGGDPDNAAQQAFQQVLAGKLNVGDLVDTAAGPQTAGPGAPGAPSLAAESPMGAGFQPGAATEPVQGWAPYRPGRARHCPARGPARGRSGSALRTEAGRTGAGPWARAYAAT